jgi:hypothetical protein
MFAKLNIEAYHGIGNSRDHRTGGGVGGKD